MFSLKEIVSQYDSFSMEQRVQSGQIFHGQKLEQLSTLLLENTASLLLSVAKAANSSKASGVQKILSKDSFHSNKSSLQISRLLLHEILFFSESGSSFNIASLSTFKTWMKELGHPNIGRKILSSSLLESTYRAVRLLYRKKMGSFSTEGGKKVFIPGYSSFAITFDGWTDEGKKNAFVAVTRHWFLDDSWELHSAVLDVIPLKGSHTGRRLALEIGIRLLDTSSLLYCGVTDNGANMILACNLLLNNLWNQEEEEEEEREEVEEFEEKGFKCQDHTLDLCINESIDSVPEVSRDVYVVRKIMTCLRGSPLIRQQLEEILLLLGLPLLSPVLDVRTRWNSTFYMLERFSVLEPGLAVLCHLGAFDHLEDMEFPSQESMARIPRYIFYLRPFEAVSRFLEGDQYTTIAHVPFLLRELELFLSQGGQEFPVVFSFRLLFLENFRRRFSPIFSQVNESLLAAALHPCYGHLEFISPSLQDQVWRKIKEWGAILYEEIHPEGEEDLLFPVISGRDNVLDRLRYRFSSQPHRDKWRYNFGIDDKGNLLRPPDWKTFYQEDERGEIPPGPRFTSIQLLVKMFFCLPATTGPSERVFSCTGFLKPKTRSRLGPLLLEYLSVIRIFVKSSFFDFEELFQTFREIIPLEYQEEGRN